MVSEDTTLPVVPQLLTCHILDSVSYAPKATVVVIQLVERSRQTPERSTVQCPVNGIFIFSVKLILKAIIDIKDAQNLMNKFYNITGSCDFVTMAIR